MKAGLNRMDIKRYHNMLDEKIPKAKIAKLLHTTVKVLDKLSPKVFNAAEKLKKQREKEAISLRKSNEEKAEVMAAAASKVLDNDPDAGAGHKDLGI